MMTPLTFIYTILMCGFATIASPLPPNGVSYGELDRRVTHTGRGTWFYDGLGNCGDWNSNTDSIVAISTQIYGNGGNCGQVTNMANGNMAYGLTRDSCPGCGPNDLDMSQGLFEQLGNLNTGVLDISWHFMAKGFSP